jgi:hypothetical protein
MNPRPVVFAAAMLLSFAVPCRAQVTMSWELELHGGGGFVNDPALDGTANLPAQGSPFTTTVGTTSRTTPSWYFGDGAALLNQVIARVGAGASIIPLDSVLRTSMISVPSGGSTGFRLSRAISRRFSAEVTFDYNFARWQLNAPVLAAVEASRASFVSAFNGLIATGPHEKAAVTSSSGNVDRRGHQTFTTGALILNFKTTGKLVPYATVGAGVNVNAADTPSVSLAGTYQFQSLGFYPVSEHDTVSAQSFVENKWVAVAGGGLKYFLSRRWGVRVDVRTYVGRRTVATSVSASPTTLTSSPTPGATATVTMPAVQFSNNLTVGPSSLAMPAVSNFRTFNGAGTQNAVNVTGGVIVRF